MTRQRQQLGRQGEEIACAFLLEKGLRLECRNYRVRSGEIDLVMWHGDILVFVEVRTRSDNFFGEPVESVQSGKRRKIINVARHFLREKKIDAEVRCRFDLVGVLLRKDQPAEIEYLPNAFMVGD